MKEISERLRKKKGSHLHTLCEKDAGERQVLWPKAQSPRDSQNNPLLDAGAVLM